jgi:hypothetical protein
MSLNQVCSNLEKSLAIPEIENSFNNINQDCNSQTCSSNDFNINPNIMDQAINIAMESFCLCGVNSFYQNSYQYYQPPMGATENGCAFGYSSMAYSTESNSGEIKGTMYENFVIYSKNDINLQLLKDFEYKTENRMTSTGRTQAVYI